MLQLYVVQQCFGLSDEGAEGWLYDSQAIFPFVGIDLARQEVTDAATLLKFRRPHPKKNNLTKTIFKTINGYLANRRLWLKAGTIVDATIIAASRSVKNKKKERAPDMHQTRKGNQWHFGMKAHIGVDTETGGRAYGVRQGSQRNDFTQTHALLHGEETAVQADAGYTGVEKREGATLPLCGYSSACQRRRLAHSRKERLVEVRWPDGAAAMVASLRPPQAPR